MLQNKKILLSIAALVFVQMIFLIVRLSHKVDWTWWITFAPMIVIALIIGLSCPPMKK